jgi:hypothetical protein
MFKKIISLFVLIVGLGSLTGTSKDYYQFVSKYGVSTKNITLSQNSQCSPHSQNS